MKRKYYILILLLLSVNCWYIKPFGNFFASNYAFVVYICALLFGVMHYYNYNKYPMLLCKWKYCKPIIWIYIGVLLSFIPAYINFHQSFISSLIASRVMLIFLTLPVLLIVRPTFKDIRLALYLFSFLFFLVILFDSFLRMPIITAIEGETVIAGRDYIVKGDYIHFTEGVHYIGMAFLFSLSQLRANFSFKKLFITLFLIGLIFLTQNRSTLFPCTIIAFITLFSIKQKKYHLFIRTFLTITFLLLIAYTIKEWNVLFNETNEQLNDKNYSRNLAMFYYLFESCPHWWEYIIGNGFISAKSNSIMQDMMERGVYNSDVGFVGLWNQFGIIPIIVFAFILFRVIICKKYDFLLKCNAWFILFSSLTIAYFGQTCKILWACIFLCMLAIESAFGSKKLIRISRSQKSVDCLQATNNESLNDK